MKAALLSFVSSVVFAGCVSHSHLTRDEMQRVVFRARELVRESRLASADEEKQIAQVEPVVSYYFLARPTLNTRFVGGSAKSRSWSSSAKAIFSGSKVHGWSGRSLTRRQSQRPQPSCRVLSSLGHRTRRAGRHASRRLWSWLIFDVRPRACSFTC
jgi:hypothetical protein